MRRIFTPVVAIAMLLGATINANAQTCTTGSTTAPVGVTFGTARAVTTGNGFSSSNQTTVGVFPNNATTEVTSNIYYYQTSQSTIYFSYTLQSANPSSTVTPTIQIRYGSPVQTITCTAASFTVANTATTYYFSITPTTAFPANTNFQVRLQLAIPNAEKNVTATLFSTNALLAAANAVLPVRFAGLEGKTVGSSVNLKWNVDVELNVNSYLVEKSIDGVRFSSIGSVAATGQRTYTFTDNQASPSAYYRIKSVDVDGKYGYSTVINVRGNSSSVIIKAFLSNPTSLTVQYDGATGGRITVSTADGRLVKNVTTVAGSQQSVVDLSSVQSGLLLVRFENASGVAETIKVIKP